MRKLPAVLLLVALSAVACRCESTEKEWWETALVYQIWPRGFQDSDGNGEGDLQGIIGRLDYLQELGIDAILLAPIYASPLIDSGYDISNHTSINPLLGKLQDFDELVEEAHRRKLKVILDVVPNHTSEKHEWFQLSSRNVKPYADYYVWAKGTPRKPPNNWVSTYSDVQGSAWTWHNTKRQWYYHKFHKSQPDLNLRNENVIQELLDVFKFWLKRDVDGFRIGGVSYLYEDEDLREEPAGGNGSYTSGLPESTALVYKFRSYIDDWVATNNATSKLLIAESYDSDEKLMSLYGNGTHKGIAPFNFRFITSIRNTSTAEQIKNVLEDWIKKLPNDTTTNWVLSNHDNSRAASRIGLNRVDGLHMLSLLLPGQAYTYYGEEIAMLDRKMSWSETIDPMGCSRTRETYANYSRDPERTPMQWNSNVSAGFSTNKITYLPVHPEYAKRNVQVQRNQTRSNLNTYKSLAALRKDRVFTHGDYEFAGLNNDRVFVMKRSLANEPIYYVVAVNLGLRQETVNLTSLYRNVEDSAEIVVASSNAVNITSARHYVLSANAGLVLRVEGKCNCDTTTTNPISTTPGKNSAGVPTTTVQLVLTSITVISLYKLSTFL